MNLDGQISSNMGGRCHEADAQRLAGSIQICIQAARAEREGVRWLCLRSLWDTAVADRKAISAAVAGTSATLQRTFRQILSVAQRPFV